MHARFVRAFIVNYKGRTVANPNPSGRRTVGVPNKMSSARVERALREGKRLPLENLLLVGCGFAMAPLCTLQSRPEFIGFVIQKWSATGLRRPGNPAASPPCIEKMPP
jgi:hypothetical protein